jgi:hypothetical protein
MLKQKLLHLLIKNNKLLFLRFKLLRELLNLKSLQELMLIILDWLISLIYLSFKVMSLIRWIMFFYKVIQTNLNLTEN